MLELIAHKMVVLLGGLGGGLGANTVGAKHGVFPERPSVMSQNFLGKLLDLGVQWRTLVEDEDVYEGLDADSNVIRTATAVDLVLNASPILRRIVEVYSGHHRGDKFAQDFAAA